MVRNYTNKKLEIIELKKYLDKEFSDDAGRPFTYKEAIKIYRAIGEHYNPKERIEIDAAVGMVMGWSRIPDIGKRVPFKLEELLGGGSREETKLNSFGEIIAALVVVSSFILGFSFVSKSFTGMAVSELHNVSVSLGALFFILGLIGLLVLIKNKGK